MRIWPREADVRLMGRLYRHCPAEFPRSHLVMVWKLGPDRLDVLTAHVGVTSLDGRIFGRIGNKHMVCYWYLRVTGELSYLVRL